MPEEGKQPSVADRVIKTGAVAAAIASIVGLVALLWPEGDPEPAKRDASFDRVKVGPPVSLEEFASRQGFADAGRPARPASIQLAASVVASGGGLAQTPEQGQETPEPAPGEMPGEEPEPPPETGTTTTPDAVVPDGQGEQPGTSAFRGVEDKLPAENLPATCSYKTIAGEAKLLCGEARALQFVAPDDVEEVAGDDQAAANAEAVLRVLRDTRSRPVAAGKSEPVGVTVSFDLTIEGFEDKEIDIRWSLFNADADTRVPRDWLVNRRALVTRPEVQSDSAEGEFWIPLPRQPGPYFVRIAAFEGKNRLASEDTKPFR